MIKIAVDAMGGDNAPEVIVDGAIGAARESEGRFEVLLVGLEEKVRKELDRHHRLKKLYHRVKKLPISIVNATQTIEMGESPIEALKKKPNSSISLGIQLQKEKKADAFVSAGNTGAVMAATLLRLDRLEGIDRPAIATFVPTEHGTAIVLDVGANVDCKPHHLLQFATMGSIYSQYIFNRENPKVGLLNVGEESSKGNELTQKTYQLLASSSLNFIGNLEGKDVLHGTADVIVCDGFVGNVLLKLTESVIVLFFSIIKQHVYTNLWAKIGAFLLKPALKQFATDFDYAEYGGAPLLGVNSTCIICHGRSTAKAIGNAIRLAAQFVEKRVNEHIKEALKKYQMAKK
ncbi:MAG: phosphate acyltransferase PlsX [Candidatus Edwardsbacteria bacterium]